MTFTLRAPRVRRLTASFGLSLTAAGIAIATLIASLSTPISALAGPSKRHSSSSTKRVHKAMVRVETARLRSSPSDSHAPTALLDAGRAASVIARKGDWAKLRFATGREGWVRADLLSISKKTVAVASTGSGKKTKAKQTAKPAAKKTQIAQRPVKRVAVAKKVAAAKPAPKKPMPVKLAASRPVVRKTSPAAALKKPGVFAFSRPLIRSSRFNPQIAASNAVKTAPAATESIAAAVVPSLPEAIIDNAPIRVAAQSPDAAQTTGTPSQETVAPVQVAMLLPESEAATAPVSAAPAKQTPPINRNLNRNERIARSALSYRGVPYRMGATGRGAFDCSGFMMYLFDKEGLDLPRTAAQQYKKGLPIPKDQMKPGDLVFFKNTYKRGVSHVGIYIGGGKFCHASSGGHAVRTDSLNKPYYVNHWAGARRPR